MYYGDNLSGSLGYNTTSRTLSIPINVVMSLSNPIPQPECGGIPQSNVLRWSSNCAGSNPCSDNLAFSNSES